MESDPEVQIHPLDVPGAAEIDGLRGLDSGLGDLASSAFVAPSPDTYACSFTSWILEEGSARAAFRASVPQILPQPPCWDARARGDGALSVVLEVNGGATNALEIKLFDREGKLAGAGEQGPPKGAPAAAEGEPPPPRVVTIEDAEREGGPPQVNAAAPSGSYNRPRFVRGLSQDVDAPILAIDDELSVVLFRPSEGGAFTFARTPIVAREAIGVARGGELLVVAKRGQSGAPRMGTRTRPGTLELHRLDADLEPLEPARPLLGGAVIYDFDACPWAHGVALLATIAGGVQLALVPVGAPDAPAPAVLDVARPPLDEGAPPYGPLSCVAIAEIDGALHLAAIERERTPDARDAHAWAGAYTPRP